MIRDGFAVRSIGDDSVEFAKKMASRFCRRRSLRMAQRDDVLQDMLVGMSQASDRYDSRRGVPFEAFARKRMMGEAIDGLARRGGVPRSAWRKGVRGPSHLVEETLGAIERPDIPDSDQVRTLRDSWNSLGEIGPLLKETVEAAHIENKPTNEIAAELGLAEVQVRQILSRGLQLLRHAVLSKADPRTEVVMDSIKPAALFNPAQWRDSLRKTVRELVTPEVMNRLIVRQIQLAETGDLHALNFLMKHGGDAIAAGKPAVRRSSVADRVPERDRSKVGRPRSRERVG